MAKRRGRRDHQIHNPIANDPLSVLLTPNPVYTQPLVLIEDRRLFHPDPPARPVMSVNNLPINRIEVSDVSPASKSRASKGTRVKYPDARVVFGADAVGSKAVLCVRRSRRREVLFAKGKGGSRKSRRVKRNRFSSIGC